MLHRVHIGNPQAVVDETARGAAASGPHNKILGTSPVHNVFDDEEIRGKLLFADDLQFLFEAI